MGYSPQGCKKSDKTEYACHTMLEKKIRVPTDDTVLKCVEQARCKKRLLVGYVATKNDTSIPHCLFKKSQIYFSSLVSLQSSRTTPDRLVHISI